MLLKDFSLILVLRNAQKTRPRPAAVKIYLRIISPPIVQQGQTSITKNYGFFRHLLGTLMANCFIVASRELWLPEKKADTALWKSSSCFCITFTYTPQQFLASHHRIRIKQKERQRSSLLVGGLT